jgi:3',5'-cyclic AMP phosphodiesterase CpdA
MTTIAHLTDVHLGPIAGFAPRYWNLKRGLGYLNWVRRRRYDHLRPVLDRIVADMVAQRPDHIAVTGDLANLGLPQEHSGALRWLQALGTPERVTVIPGNHDIYSGIGRDPGTGRWSAYMSSNAEGRGYADGEAALPFVRVVGEVAMVGVNSAVETPPAAAWGRVGERQLAALARVLGRLRDTGLFRLVLVHHPPLPGQLEPMRSLRDADRLEAVLAESGADLVIHGHSHSNMLAWLQSGAEPAAAPGAGQRCIAVVGAPSASMGRTHRREALGRYNLYRIERGARGGVEGGSEGSPERGSGRAPESWRAEMIGRGLAEPNGPVVELERRELTCEPGCR